MMLRVTTMEILKLSYWNPARDMKSVLKDIKDFLRMWARLDLQSERNDRSRYPDGAYIDIEHHLLRLALVSEIVPRANKKYVVATPPAKASLPASALESTTPTPPGSSGSHRKKLGGASSSSGSGAGASSSPAAGAVSAAAAGSDPGPSTSSGAGAGAVSADKEMVKKYKKFALFGLSTTKEKDKDEKRGSKAQKKMAKGVGYSSYQQKGWDPKAYMAAQREKDKQIELVLGKIYQELRKLHHGGSSNQASEKNLPELLSDGAGGGGGAEDDEQAAGAVGGAAASSAQGSRSGGNSNSSGGGGGSSRSGSRRKRKHSPDEVAAANASNPSGGSSSSSNEGHEDDGASSSSSASPIDPQSDLFAVLEGSALIPFLESKLQANSFLEICAHKNVYMCVVNIVREIAGQPYLVPLLAPLPDQSSSLQSLLLALETQARVLLDKIGKASANGSVPRTASASASSSSSGSSGASGSSGSGAGAGGGASEGGAGRGAVKMEKFNEKASDDKLARY